MSHEFFHRTGDGRRHSLPYLQRPCGGFSDVDERARWALDIPPNRHDIVRDRLGHYLKRRSASGLAVDEYGTDHDQSVEDHH